MALLSIILTTCKYYTLYVNLPVVSFLPPPSLLTIAAATASTIPTVVSRKTTPCPVVSPPMPVTYQLHVPLTPPSSLVQPEMKILWLFLYCGVGVESECQCEHSIRHWLPILPMTTLFLLLSLLCGLIEDNIRTMLSILRYFTYIYTFIYFFTWTLEEKQTHKHYASIHLSKYGIDIEL